MQTWDLPSFRALVAATIECCILYKIYIAELPKEGKKRNCPERATTLKIHSSSEKALAMLCLLRGTTPKRLSEQMGPLLEEGCSAALHGFLEIPCPLSSYPFWSFPSPTATYSKTGRGTEVQCQTLGSIVCEHKEKLRVLAGTNLIKPQTHTLGTGEVSQEQEYMADIFHKFQGRRRALGQEKSNLFFWLQVLMLKPSHLPPW